MNFEKSADTKVLEHVLSEVAVGEMVTYEQLSKAIGRDVREHALPSLSSARRGLLNQKKYVFGIEHNVGLRRLNDSQIVDASESDRAKLKRAANRAISKLAVVNFDQLPADKKRQHTIASAQMGAVAMFAGKTATKKIASSVNDSKTTLAIGETLKMFS
jgi:hypothetical protein